MNKEQFNRFFELGLIGMAIITPEENFIEVNNFLCDILGYSKNELLKKKWSHLIHPDDIDSYKKKLNRMLSGKIDAYTMEKRFIHKNGDIIHVNISVKSFRNSEGIIENIILLIQDITERKKAESRIRESELKYRTIVENSREFIWQLDKNGNFVFFNKYAEEISMMKSSEWIGKKFIPAIYPKDLNRVNKIFKDTLSGNINEYEVRIFDGNGEIVELLVQTLPVYTDGEISGTLSFGRNITDWKKAEYKLKNSEERYSSLIDNIPVGIFRSTIDQSGSFLSINLALAKMFAYDNIEEMMTIRVADCYKNPEDRKIFINNINKDISVSGYEVQLKRKDGSTFWGSLSAKVIKNKNSWIQYIDGILENITEQKTIQEALKESQERYQRLVDHNPASIVVHVGGKIVYCNKASLNLIAASSPEDALGKMIFNFVHPDYRNIVIDRVNLCQKEGKLAETIEEKFLRLDGKSVDVEVAAIPITYQGKPATQVVFWDITKRKQAESSIQKSLDELNRTLKGTVDALSSMVETRDPYTAGHQKEVAKFACAIAKEMNLSEEFIEGLRVASLLHDIGKIKIPAEILSKPAFLTDIEYNLIKIHPQAGLEILKTITFPWPVGKIVFQHQERLNGSGYPNGLQGDEICLEARILAVADVVEAMCSHRPYRSSLGLKKAFEEIKQNKGKLYDADVVNACLKLFKKNKYSFNTK